MTSYGILQILPSNCIKFVFFPTTKKLSVDVESPHFLTFSAKCCECKIGKRDGHGQSRNGHGKNVCQVCANPWMQQITDASKPGGQPGPNDS